MEVDSILGAVCALFLMRNFQYGLVAMDQLIGPKNPLIVHLVIFPHGLQPGNSTKVTCLEIIGYWIKYSTVLWLLELQIRCGQMV